MLMMLNKVGELSKSKERVQSLLNLVNKESLTYVHNHQPSKKAVGVDGITKEMYGLDLDNNLDILLGKMRRFHYYPVSVRRVNIPKANGKTRPLGIPSYEDKLVQGVMANILTAVYEPRFRNVSFGFRPKLSCHDAIREINSGIMFNKVNYIIDADIKGFFDNINHTWLLKFLEHDIDDRKFIRYCERFMTSGYIEQGVKYKTETGTPQGGLISPVLANVYLHYVLDVWFEDLIKVRSKGYVKLVRYADDFVIMCQFEEEANEILELLIKRLAKFNLELEMDKTKILPFGRFKGTRESFDFLGFRHINGVSRGGKYQLQQRTSKSKLKQKKQENKAWLTLNMHEDPQVTLHFIKLKLNGHYNYYGINGNYLDILKFYKYIKYEYYRVLKRRGQKNQIKYKKFKSMWDYANIPKPKLKVAIW